MGQPSTVLNSKNTETTQNELWAFVKMLNWCGIIHVIKGEVKNSHTILVIKPERKKSLGRPRQRQKY